MNTVQICPQGQGRLADVDPTYSEYFCFALQDTKSERELQDGQILPWTPNSMAITEVSSPTQTVSEPSSSFTTGHFSSVDIYSCGSPASPTQNQLLGHSHLSPSPYSSFIDTGSPAPLTSDRDGHIRHESLGVNHATSSFGLASPTPYLHAEGSFVLPPAAPVDMQPAPMLSWSSSSMDSMDSMDVLLQSHSDFNYLLPPPADSLDPTGDMLKSEPAMRSHEAAFDFSSDRSDSTHYFHQERRHPSHPSRPRAAKQSRQRSCIADMPLCTAAPASAKSARRHSTSSIARKSYACAHSDCTHSFSRQADLERHIDHVHTEDGMKKRFECDYAACPRNASPFHRKDHFRDHLRDQHKEDIPKRGSNAHQTVRRDPSGERSSVVVAKTKTVKKDKSDDELLLDAAARNGEQQRKDGGIQPDWWRCSRCLKRVRVDEHSWTCPTCKGNIEQARHAFRTRF